MRTARAVPTPWLCKKTMMSRITFCSAQAATTRAVRFGPGSCWIPGSWDLPMSYHPIVVTLSSLKPFFFNGLKKEVVFQKWRWSLSYCPSKSIAVDKQADDEVVHLYRFREADRLADQAFDPRP